MVSLCQWHWVNQARGLRRLWLCLSTVLWSGFQPIETVTIVNIFICFRMSGYYTTEPPDDGDGECLGLQGMDCFFGIVGIVTAACILLCLLLSCCKQVISCKLSIQTPRSSSSQECMFVCWPKQGIRFQFGFRHKLWWRCQGLFECPMLLEVGSFCTSWIKSSLT